jgi:hypothetical protein
MGKNFTTPNESRLASRRACGSIGSLLRSDDAIPIQFTVLAAKLIPVTLMVNNETPTIPRDYILVIGNTVELGQ